MWAAYRPEEVLLRRSQFIAPYAGRREAIVVKARFGGVIAAAVLVLAGCACSPSEDAAPAATAMPQTPAATATPTPTATPTSEPSATPTAPESPLATPTQVIPPASDIAFPEGSTYWRNQARIPVIVYRAADTLCWYYWTGLEAKQRFTGTLTPEDTRQVWNGVLGTLAYPGETPSAIRMTVEFSPLSDSGNWLVARIDEPATGADSYLLYDGWAPITAEDAAADFAQNTGLTGYEAPVLTSCPAPSDFGG